MKIKKIVAGTVAGVMAASMMSVGANAQDVTSGTWGVHYAPGAPSQYNISVDNLDLDVVSTKTKLYDYCTYFSQNSNHGANASVTVTAYKFVNGVPTTLLLSSTYIGTGGGALNFPYAIYNGSKIRVTHTLNMNGNAAGMSGNTWI